MIFHFLRKIYGRLRSVDRVFFPAWLIFQCAVRGRKAVVVRRVEALGDVVCTLPTCAALRERYPSRFIVLISNIFCSRIARLSPQVDAVYGASSSTIRIPKNFMGLVAESFIAETQDNVSNAGSTLHLVDDLAASCGVTLQERQPILRIPSFIKERIRRNLQLRDECPLIIINPGPTWPVRNWPAHYWQELIDHIHAEFNVAILMVGSPRQGIASEYDRLKGVKLLAGALRSDELAALIAISHLVISIDSGPVHVAGAVGTPVIGLFGAVNPQLRLPPNSPSIGLCADVPCLFCHHRTPIGHWQTGCQHNIRCMTNLKSVDVIKAAIYLSQNFLNDKHEVRLPISPSSV